MFYWDLFWVLLLFTLPGIFFFIPATIEFTHTIVRPFLAPGLKNVSVSALKKIAIGEATVVFAAVIALGVWFSPIVQFRFTFFHALVEAKNIAPAFSFQVPYGVLVGTVGALVSAVFSRLMAPGKERRSLLSSYVDYKNKTGIFRRLLFGAFSEEIFFRWGLYCVVCGVLFLLGASKSSSAVQWGGAVFIGLLNAAAHILPAWGSGMPKTVRSVCLIFCEGFLYGFAGCILVWKSGLLSAILARLVWISLGDAIDAFLYSNVNAS